jgi:hypothetical protein
LCPKITRCLIYVCRGPDINLNIKEEDADDDGEMKCWADGNDADKSKSKQQLDGETVLRNILREVVFKNSVVMESIDLRYTTNSTQSPFLTLLSRRAQSGSQETDVVHQINYIFSYFFLVGQVAQSV